MSLDRYRAILCDLDGCLISGETALPGAARFVEALRPRLYIVSNNSTDTAQTLSERLARLGLALPPDRLLLAGAYAVEVIATAHPGARIALFAAPPLAAKAAALGLIPEDAAPEIVLLARDTAFNYARLARLVGHLHAGARLIVTNPDTSHPGPDGGPVPETGALLQAVRSCVPEGRYEVIGKPQVALIEAALLRAGVHPTEAVFIGDNAATDGLGAARAGVDFLQIGGPGQLGPLTLAALTPRGAPAG